MFKHHRYPKFIILQAVYFKFRFTLSYRDIEELMKIRGVKVDYSKFNDGCLSMLLWLKHAYIREKIEFVLIGEWMKPILR